MWSPAMASRAGDGARLEGASGVGGRRTRWDVSAWTDHSLALSPSQSLSHINHPCDSDVIFPASLPLLSLSVIILCALATPHASCTPSSTLFTLVSPRCARSTASNGRGQALRLAGGACKRCGATDVICIMARSRRRSNSPTCHLWPISRQFSHARAMSIPLASDLCLIVAASRPSLRVRSGHNMRRSHDRRGRTTRQLPVRSL